MTEYELMVQKYGMDCAIEIPALKGDKSLRKLDDYTTRYKDQIDLMNHLFDMDCIKYDEIPLKPMIGYTHMGFFHKVDVLYQDDEKYLNIEVLTERIIDLGKRLVYGVQDGSLSEEDRINDINLVKKIISTYFTNPMYKKYIFFLRTYLADLEQKKFSVEHANNFQAALKMILDNELTTLSKKDGGYRDNYKGIRVMAYMFSQFDRSIEEAKKPKKPVAMNYEQLLIPGFEEEYKKAIQRSRTRKEQ